MDERPEVNEENLIHERSESVLVDVNTKNMSELKSN